MIIGWCMARSGEMYEAKRVKTSRYPYYRSFQSIRYQQLPDTAALYTSGTCDLECWYNGWVSKKSFARERARAHLFHEARDWKGIKKLSYVLYRVSCRVLFRLFIPRPYTLRYVHANGKTSSPPGSFVADKSRDVDLIWYACVRACVHVIPEEIFEAIRMEFASL